MCTVCGCDGAPVILKDDGSGHGHDHHHDHHHHDHTDDDHTHGHDHADQPGADTSTSVRAIHYGSGTAGVSVPGVSQGDLVAIERRVLSKNDAIAMENRRRLATDGVIAINMMSSPGSGKTTLLVKTITALSEQFPVTVIEGDQQTSNDAARIRETGAPAIQVNTGKGCHLDAQMVADALGALPSRRGGLIFIENVGNLVCPASFDLGEAKRVVLASVTEGEDKPLKYPDMFASADLVVVTKTDLLPHLRFNVGELVENARRVRPGVPVILSSSESDEALEPWLAWLRGLVGIPAVAAE
ncbi:MAG: hydrogenase nickel incorporation protein HypB [Pseudomonadota bacterium]